jgi:hypothetical protein
VLVVMRTVSMFVAVVVCFHTTGTVTMIPDPHPHILHTRLQEVERRELTRGVLHPVENAVAVEQLRRLAQHAVTDPTQGG